MVLCPDTSPRGLNLPGEKDAWDFGQGAGFYVDAVTSGYRDHYKMYSYINEEIYGLIEKVFGLGGRISIAGHSMGGHGALTLALRNPERYRAVSAFAPISHPTACPWGQKAFHGYFGADQTLWELADTCSLLKKGFRFPGTILVDQGTEDNFWKEGQLMPEELSKVCQAQGQGLELRYQEGYDHSYYFVASFIEDHIAFHAKAIG
jgi:S-formylglutathione hydrolase